MERRTLLVGAGALVVGALAAGAAGIATLDRTRFFAAILRRCLPDAVVPDVEVMEFAAAYGPLMEQRYGARAAMMRLLHAADRLLVPGEMPSSADLERDILTTFLIGSNFFDLKDPKRDAIDFIGITDACANPFRRV